MTPSRWLSRSGLRLAVYDAGGAGLPVVFQHGLCGDARQTAEAFPPDLRFRRITLECRGHGASELGDDVSITTFAEDVAALIDTLPGPVILGGISMGAAIALLLAVRRPELVRGLILVRPAWGCEAAPANMQPNAEVGDLLRRLPPDVGREAFATSATARALAAVAPDNLSSLMGFFTREPVTETARLLCAIAADGPGVSEADLARIAQPALVCGTPEDTIHPLALAVRLAKLIPGAGFAELPAKGRDKPAHIAALHAAMTEFLKEFSDA